MTEAKVCDTIDEYEAAGPGAIFLWLYGTNGDQGHAMVKCPGCGHSSGMHLRNPGMPHPDGRASWEVSGLPRAITFHPSLNCVGCCGWHNWLQAGVWGDQLEPDVLLAKIAAANQSSTP